MLITSSILLAGAGQVGYFERRAALGAVDVNNYASILAGGAHLNLAFGHTWSLAVEEHFYLVWPLVLVTGQRRLGSRRLLALTLALCLAALGYRALIAVTVHASPVFFYFDSLSRADSFILYGYPACLAVRQGWRPRRWQLVAAVILMCGFLDANPVADQRPARVAGSPGLAGAVIVAGVDQGPGPRTVRRCLGLPPLRYLGARSYSLYLWHLPLLAYVIAVVHVDSFTVRLIWAALSAPFALACFRWVETPVRDAVRASTSDRPPAPGAAAPSPFGPRRMTRSGRIGIVRLLRAGSIPQRSGPLISGAHQPGGVR